MRPIAEALSLDWSSQIKRLRRDPVLAEAIEWVVIMTTHRGEQRTLCLPLDIPLPGWLFGISGTRVKPELQEQRSPATNGSAYDVLWNAFKGDIVPAAPAPPVDLNPAEQALLLAEAVASLARQHLDLEQRHLTMADYLRPFVAQTRSQLTAHEERLGRWSCAWAAG